jgi:hypothetical protein
MGNRIALPPPGPAPQPTFSNVKLLFPFNGDDGDTSNPLDMSDRNDTGWATTNAALDTGQKKWGTASLRIFDGNGASIRRSDHADLELGSSSFWIEVWGRYATSNFTSQNHVIMSHWNSAGSNNGFIFRMLSDKSMQFTYSTDGDNSFSITSLAQSFNVDQWHHLAVARDPSGNIYLFLRGKLIKVQNIGADVIFNHDQPLGIGAYRLSGSSWIQSWGGNTPVRNTPSDDGWFDDFRMGIGEPLYTESFIPPTGPHPVGALELESSVDRLQLEGSTDVLGLE